LWQSGFIDSATRTQCDHNRWFSESDLTLSTLETLLWKAEASEKETRKTFERWIKEAENRLDEVQNLGFDQPSNGRKNIPRVGAAENQL